MNYLIDIGHPAHVHLFRNFAKAMLSEGHNVLFTSREKESETELLKHFGFSYSSFGRKYSSTAGKLWGMLEFDMKELLASLRFKPDFLLSHGSPYAAHTAFLLRKPHISFEDTFNFEQIRLYKPFTAAILTANYDHPFLGSRNIRYPGYHELAYLHPAHFTPDPSVVRELGVNEGEKYFIVRFVSWEASHDIGHTGITMENKMRVVNELQQHGKVFISSEKKLPSELEANRIRLPFHRMHDAMAYATLLYGESGTMASEAAVLGVPAIFLDNDGRLYTREQEEKYGLVFNFTESPADQARSIEKAAAIASAPAADEEWKQKRDRMLAEKVDVSAFLCWFIRNWPGSFEKMKADSEYFNRIH